MKSCAPLIARVVLETSMESEHLIAELSNDINARHCNSVTQLTNREVRPVLSLAGCVVDVDACPSSCTCRLMELSLISLAIPRTDQIIENERLHCPPSLNSLAHIDYLKSTAGRTRTISHGVLSFPEKSSRNRTLYNQELLTATELHPTSLKGTSQTAWHELQAQVQRPLLPNHGRDYRRQP